MFQPLEQLMGISIHAPREGGDCTIDYYQTKTRLFQSTPPARGATTTRISPSTSGTFQSTPPARGATTSKRSSSGLMPISIHAPREGGDLCVYRNLAPLTPDFNPRPPRGGRRVVFIASYLAQI